MTQTPKKWESFVGTQVKSLGLARGVLRVEWARVNEACREPLVDLFVNGSKKVAADSLGTSERQAEVYLELGRLLRLGGSLKEGWSVWPSEASFGDTFPRTTADGWEPVEQTLNLFSFVSDLVGTNASDGAIPVAHFRQVIEQSDNLQEAVHALELLSDQAAAARKKEREEARTILRSLLSVNQSITKAHAAFRQGKYGDPAKVVLELSMAKASLATLEEKINQDLFPQDSEKETAEAAV